MYMCMCVDACMYVCVCVCVYVCVSVLWVLCVWVVMVVVFDSNIVAAVYLNQPGNEEDLVRDYLFACAEVRTLGITTRVGFFNLVRRMCACMQSFF